jgi:hypothetical protein
MQTALIIALAILTLSILCSIWLVWWAGAFDDDDKA